MALRLLRFVSDADIMFNHATDASLSATLPKSFGNKCFQVLPMIKAVELLPSIKMARVVELPVMVYLPVNINLSFLDQVLFVFCVLPFDNLLISSYSFFCDPSMWSLYHTIEPYSMMFTGSPLAPHAFFLSSVCFVVCGIGVVAGR